MTGLTGLPARAWLLERCKEKDLNGNMPRVVLPWLPRGILREHWGGEKRG